MRKAFREEKVMQLTSNSQLRHSCRLVAERGVKLTQERANMMQDESYRSKRTQIIDIIVVHTYTDNAAVLNFTLLEAF